MTGRWIVRREWSGHTRRFVWAVYTPEGHRQAPHLYWRDAIRKVDREVSC